MNGPWIRWFAALVIVSVSLGCAVCGRFCLETVGFPKKIPRIRSGNAENCV